MNTEHKWSIPTTYKGTRFRSKLEATYAEFFDIHHMVWAYESEGFDLHGVWYLPDFYLPEIRAFVEVKGILDDSDSRKLEMLARVAAGKNIMVIVAEAPAPYRLRVCYPTPQVADCSNGDLEKQPFSISEEVDLARCRECRRWYFRDTVMSWACTACGYCDGDHTFSQIHPGTSTFWLSRDYCADCGASWT